MPGSDEQTFRATPAIDKASYLPPGRIGFSPFSTRLIIPAFVRRLFGGLIADVTFFLVGRSDSDRLS